MPSLETLFARFGLSLVLGFLIGLERERDKAFVFAGMRTFALISFLGALMAFGSEQFAGYWLFVVGYAAVAGYGLLSYFQGFESGHIGITTEVVFQLAYMLGALVYWDLLALAAAATVAIVVILTFKPGLQTFLAKVDREDIRAGLEFAIVWAIIMPVLPDRTYGPLDVLNPREIWLMVVLVSGINLASYVLSQIYGAQRSIGLTGLLGGMISSTAVTFEFTRRSQNTDERQHAPLFALAVVVASTGMFFRVPILAMLFNFLLGIRLLIPMMVGAAISSLGIAYMAWRIRKAHGDLQGPRGKEARSPFALRPALTFGAIFAVVLLLSKGAQIYLGETGTYLSSIIGGLAGLDAITLSVAKLSGSGIPEATAARALVLAAGSNMLFKGMIAALLGRDAVRRHILPLFVLAAVGSVAAAFLI